MPTYAPDRVMVKFTAEGLLKADLDLPLEMGAATVQARTGLPSLDAVIAAAGVRRITRTFSRLANTAEAERLGVYRWFQFQVPGGTEIPALAAQLQNDPNVELAVPDYVAFADAVPDDPLYPSNWGHNNTAQLPEYDWGGTWAHTGDPVGLVGFDANAEGAWDGYQGYGDPGVVIAIIDGGVDVTHPDLNVVAGYDFGDMDSDPSDDSANPGHGTSCAGVAAAIADNALGVTGVAGGCGIMACKVANSEGSMYFSAIANAIYYAADQGADIISMSFSADITSEPLSDAALIYAYNANVIAVASAGNYNVAAVRYPARHAKVLAVGAASPCGERKRSSDRRNELNPDVEPDPNGVTCDNEKWWGSNYCSTYQDSPSAVDVIAPTILPTTDIQGSAGYGSGDYTEFLFNGTSCAVPYVAGVCALVKSANPSWTNQQIWDQVVGTAQDVVNIESVEGWDVYSGYGMVDALAAIGGGPTVPVANFSADPTDVCAPNVVFFTDLSEGTINEWAWDFGDGGTSDQQFPSHAYPLPGTYTVSLTVTGPLGSDTIVMPDLITARVVPDAIFSALPLSGEAPLTVDFTDESTNDPTSWNWFFGDDTSSEEQNPSHTYTTPGLYTVTLVAGNDCGQDMQIRNDYIEVLASTEVVADFEADPLSGCEPLEVTFTDLSTGEITDWLWEFGDGETSFEQNPVHTYASFGDYSVSLTVTGPAGSDTAQDAVTISVQEAVLPVAAFSASVVEGPYPLEVTFTDESTGSPTSWAWDFGDGETDTQQNPIHTYADQGTYTVTLTVGGPCGEDQLVKPDLILVLAPSAVGEAAPAVFALDGNYPNPFNPTTTILFSLAEPGFARLEVFDATGRRLQTLVAEERGAGLHRVTWQPTDVASGVYFARLSAGGQVATQRMVLVR